VVPVVVEVSTLVFARNRALRREKRLADRVMTTEIRVEWRQLDRFNSSSLVKFPFFPMSEERIEAINLIRVFVEAPVDSYQPLHLHLVELSNRDVAHFRPGTILECIVVEELAAEK
jgi:hypothetical protein